MSAEKLRVEISNCCKMLQLSSFAALQVQQIFSTTVSTISTGGTCSKDIRLSKGDVLAGWGSENLGLEVVLTETEGHESYSSDPGLYLCVYNVPCRPQT